MARKDSYKYPKAGILVGLAVVAVAVSGILTATTAAHVASADKPNPITDRPSGTDKILKVKSIEVQEEMSKNKDIDLTAESNAEKIQFKATNKADKDSSLGVDVWKISVHGAVFDIGPLFISATNNDSVNAKSSKVVNELNFDDYSEHFEQYPGKYEITLLGINIANSLAKAQQSASDADESNPDDLAIFKIKANVVVGYDEAAIKAKGHLLKATNAQFAIDGNNPFIITTDEKRNAVISIVNNQDYAVSALVSYQSVTAMNTELTKAAGFDAISEYQNDVCLVLKPGESKVIRTITLGKEVFPLGGEGDSLAKKTGDGTVARAGTYVFDIEGGTKPCSIDGENFPGMAFEGMAAFEVS